MRILPRTLFPRTLGGQLLTLLLLALGASLLFTLYVYSRERAAAVAEADRSGAFENLISVVRLIQLAPSELRPALAAEASVGRLRLWVSEDAAVPASVAVSLEAGGAGPLDRLYQAELREPPRIGVLAGPGRLRNGGGDEAVRFELPVFDTIRIAPTATPAAVLPAQAVPVQIGPQEPVRSTPGRVVAAAPAQAISYTPRDDVVVSVPLRDNSGWINAQTVSPQASSSWAWPAISTTGVMAVAILLIVAFTTRRSIRPLKALAARADQLGRGAAGPPMSEEGPEEVRRVTAAFNQMQDRLGKFVADRTRMIAAIGHDLRTPITSLRLRAELLDDDESKGKMLATLEDMQRMVEATLAFARDEAASEEPRTVDLAALVASVVDDQADIGKDATFTESARLAYRCRPVALKRAIGNLVANAVEYGDRARVRLEHADGPLIVVEDDGAGIPPNRLDDVFKPFVRLEESRSRSTGGVGLGLSIARSIVLAHGGELVLANRPEGGLRAEIRLPASAEVAAAGGPPA